MESIWRVFGGCGLAEKVSTTQDINAAIKKQLKRSKTIKITGLSGQNYIAVGLTTKKQLVFSGKAGEFYVPTWYSEIRCNDKAGGRLF